MRGARQLILLAALLACASSTQARRTLKQGGGKTRRYYIAANTIVWDYAPKGINACQGRNFSDSEALYTRNGAHAQYVKAQFQAFSDASFTQQLPRPAREEHLGNMGPLLRAAVGDIIEVHVLNNLTFPFNLEPAGVMASAHTAVKIVEPGKTIVYAWSVPDQAGPSANSNSTSTMWLYRSTLDQQAHANAGLYGPIIITKAADADANGAPKDVNQEYITLFQVVDESASPFATASAKKFGGADGQNGISDDDFGESSLKHSINGRIFCNLDGLNVTAGEKVRWHTIVQGNEVDVHNVHWHGLVLSQDGSNVDQFNVLPAKTWTADLVTDNPGIWLLHCHVNKHFSAGMQALVTLTGKQAAFNMTGVERTFYVQAEEDDWNYTPVGGNMCSGRNTSFIPDAEVYLTASPDRIGRVNIKARYIEYTDDTFTQQRVRTDAEQHLGLLGPVIRGEVGDKINVVFRNKVRFPTTIHVHGLLYNKSSEGSGYADGTSGADKADDGVPTNGTHTYVYFVPERAGPGPEEPSSKLWMYHSHADEAADTYAGLMGAIVISRRGSSRPDGTPVDVDREFVMFFSVMNEMASSLFVANLNKALGPEYVGVNGLPEVHSSNPMASANNTLGGDLITASGVPISIADLAASSNMTKLSTLLEDSEFQESNLKHSINGFMYCNLPGLQARMGQRVRFYVMSLGTEVDLHTPNLEAATLDWQGQGVSSLFFLPGNMETADAQLTAEGRWLFRCRVADHVGAGMEAMFLTHPADGSALAPALATTRAEPAVFDNGATPSDPNADFDDGPGNTPQADVALDSSAQLKSATLTTSKSAATPALEPLLKANTVTANTDPNADPTRNITLPGSSAADSAAIYSTGRPSGSNSLFSKVMAGLSLTPLADIAFAFGQSVRDSLFGSSQPPSLASVAKSTPTGQAVTVPVTRTYYIQAEQLVWNYFPTGIDRCSGEKPEGDQQLYTMTLNDTLGPQMYKALYRAYTDETFTTPLQHDPSIGIMGPLIYAQVGDTLNVFFRNTLSFGVNLFLGGGAIPMDSMKATATVDQGVTFEYTWQIPEEAGPQEDDPSTIHFPYYSTVDLVPHQYSGLVGVVAIGRMGTFAADGSIPGIDVVQPLLFNIWDESKSVYFQANIKARNPDVDQSDPNFVEGNLKHGINGYVYCNMPDVHVQQNGTVRWMLIGMGTENDMHSPFFENQVLTYDKEHTATAMLFPAVTRTADMLASKPGIWQYRCDVQDHLLAGMRGRLVVDDELGSAPGPHGPYSFAS